MLSGRIMCQNMYLSSLGKSSEFGRSLIVWAFEGKRRKIPARSLVESADEGKSKFKRPHSTCVNHTFQGM